MSNAVMNAWPAQDHLTEFALSLAWAQHGIEGLTMEGRLGGICMETS